MRAFVILQCALTKVADELGAEDGEQATHAKLLMGGCRDLIPSPDPGFLCTRDEFKTLLMSQGILKLLG